MTYTVREIYYTLQGEGAQTGRPAVFLRFAGCNLWSGRQQDRASAVCNFCDTEFVGTGGPGGGKFPDAKTLAEAVTSAWPVEADSADPKFVPYVVCTGGEPLLQLDTAAVDALHAAGLTGCVSVRKELRRYCKLRVTNSSLCIRNSTTTFSRRSLYQWHSIIS